MIEKLNVRYEGDMTARYMCFDALGAYGDFREKMLEKNRIDGYLPLSIIYSGEEKIYRYDISDKKALSDILAEKSMTEEMLLALLKDLEKIFIKGKSFMLEEMNYVLHPDALYLSHEGRAFACYLPGYEKDVKEQLSGLFGYFMDCVDINDRRSVYAVYSAFVAAGEENCTFSALISLMERNREIGRYGEEVFRNEGEKNLIFSDNEAEKQTERALMKGDAADREKEYGAKGSLAKKSGGFAFLNAFTGEKRKREIGQFVLIAAFAVIVIYFIFSVS